MIDHVMLSVRNVEASREFYREALEPLGYALAMEGEGYAGFGPTHGSADLWLAERGPNAPTHVALSSPDRATVDAFHQAALAAGGQDNGAPGIRADYHENYYGAYVLDPDGNNIEAVCHAG
jgi:catechol 2,3-dioxygenase-like lactoylglutathione lyase family enzyme